MKCKHCGGEIEYVHKRTGYRTCLESPAVAEPAEEPIPVEKSQTEKDLVTIMGTLGHGPVKEAMARLILKLWDRQSRTEDNLDQMYKNQEALSNRA